MSAGKIAAVPSCRPGSVDGRDGSTVNAAGNDARLASLSTDDRATLENLMVAFPGSELLRPVEVAAWTPLRPPKRHVPAERALRGLPSDDPRRNQEPPVGAASTIPIHEVQP